VRILLTVFGSRGDAHPLLALASALQKAGHHAVVTGPPDFVHDAHHNDVPYVPHGPNVQSLLHDNRTDMGANPMRMVRAVRRKASEHIDMQFEAVGRLARDTDMIIAAGLMWAASSVAQAYGLAYRYVAYAPEVVRSKYHAPPLSPWQNLPEIVNRMAWVGFEKIVDWLVLPTVNRNRIRLGLPELRWITPHLLPRESTILAADPEIATWAVDAGIPTTTLGALQLEDARTLDPAIEQFLAAGEPPVYIGFGSMVDPAAGKTTKALVEVVERVGCRAIIGAGWAGLGLTGAGPRILCVGPTPHQKLFSRVVAVVHHGGAGTTHTAARAGVPQLLIPHLLDQFAWAKRIHRLGLSPKPIPRSRLNAKNLALGLRECLTDPDLRQRAGDMKKAIEQRVKRHDPLAGLALERVVSVASRRASPEDGAATVQA
jgi:vancomycin aglycone glucosyltransferase